ncbi:MAG TPA: transposase [Amycolatopsis sp.]|nr:transposase [Amycolatopsis sp.]HKS46433.1 transposase [Amycolatopsis sp.]
MSNLAMPHERSAPCFARAEPFAQAGKYVAALMSDLPRQDGCSIAEHAGDATPDRTQRLLDHAVWDHEAAMAMIRGFVAEHLGAGTRLVVALDESEQEKTGAATAGVQRQYLGCAGRIANGVNTVYCTYATQDGHALVGARIYLPVDQCGDDERRAAPGIADDVEVRTKPNWRKRSLPTWLPTARCRLGPVGTKCMAAPGDCLPFSKNTRWGTCCGWSAPSAPKWRPA